MGNRDLLLVFGSVQRVMRAERAARAAGLAVAAVPAPRAVSSQCGVVLEVMTDDREALDEILSNIDVTPQSVWRRNKGGWAPSSLDAVVLDDVVKLTDGSAYGGCGAKLAKGLLEKILCGLPRLESEDVLVGIEYADDAGVIRQRLDKARWEMSHYRDYDFLVVNDVFDVALGDLECIVRAERLRLARQQQRLGALLEDLLRDP